MARFSRRRDQDACQVYRSGRDQSNNSFSIFLVEMKDDGYFQIYFGGRSTASKKAVKMGRMRFVELFGS